VRFLIGVSESQHKIPLESTETCGDLGPRKTGRLEDVGPVLMRLIQQSPQVSVDSSGILCCDSETPIRKRT